MTGYRQHGFDPNAYQDPGRPMRPFNWVQWTGVGVIAVCCALELIYFAGRFGWIEPLFEKSPRAFLFVIVGLVMINSRREPPRDVAPELAAERRRWLLIVIVASVTIVGLAFVADLWVNA
jgi:hypothetical protein